jgi:hypothetical protein
MTGICHQAQTLVEMLSCKLFALAALELQSSQCPPGMDLLLFSPGSMSYFSHTMQKAMLSLNCYGEDYSNLFD